MSLLFIKNHERAQYSLVEPLHDFGPSLVGCERGGRGSRGNGFFLFKLPESIDFCLDFIRLGLIEVATDPHPEPQRYVFFHRSHRFPHDLIFTDIGLIEKVGFRSRRPPIDHRLFDLGVPVELDIRLERCLLLRWTCGKVQAGRRTFAAHAVFRSAVVEHPAVKPLIIMIRMETGSSVNSITYGFFYFPNCDGRDEGIAAHSFDVLRRGSGWPAGEVLLVEGGEELAERLVLVVLLVQVVLSLEPFLLLGGTCRGLASGEGGQYNLQQHNRVAHTGIGGVRVSMVNEWKVFWNEFRTSFGTRGGFFGKEVSGYFRAQTSLYVVLNSPSVPESHPLSRSPVVYRHRVQIPCEFYRLLWG